MAGAGGRLLRRRLRSRGRRRGRGGTAPSPTSTSSSTSPSPAARSSSTRQATPHRTSPTYLPIPRALPSWPPSFLPGPPTPRLARCGVPQQASILMKVFIQCAPVRGHFWWLTGLGGLHLCCPRVSAPRFRTGFFLPDDPRCDT